MSGLGLSNFGSLSAPIQPLSEFDTFLGNQSSATQGAGLIGFNGALAYLPGSVGNALQTTLASIPGADPTGLTPSDAAFQIALNAGFPINFGGPANRWLFTTQSTYTGQVVLTGSGATIVSNVLFLKVIDGTNSVITGNINIVPQTTPYTIKRNTTTWVPPTITQSLQGYTPTSQDVDIWSAFSGTAPQLLNLTIHPGILFTVSGASGASGLNISGLTGYQINLIIQGYSNLKFHDNNIGAGGLSYGGLIILGGINRNYDSSFAGFTFPRGTNNAVYNNSIQYASFCPIVLFGQDDYSIFGNNCTLSGESGIKTYQYDGVAGPSETSACISTTGRIFGNKCSDNYYDGIDASIYGGSIAQTYFYTGTAITGNLCERNHQTGSITNGYNILYSGNFVNSNGTHGISAAGGDQNSVIGNYTRNNMTTGTTQVAQPFEIALEGDDCVGVGNSVINTVAYSTYLYFHSGAVGGSPTTGHEGLDSGNYSSLNVASVYVDSKIPSSRSGLKTNGYISTSSVKTIVAATYSIDSGAVPDSAISFFTAATCTVTLPAASSFPGRQLKLRNTAAFAINSATSNVGPIVGGAAGTAILTATSGKWCDLQSDGSIWVIMASN